MIVFDLVRKNKLLLKNNEKEFKEIFKLNLKDFLGDSIQLLTGFDIIKFEYSLGKIVDITMEELQKEWSLKELVQHKYGEKAVQLIEMLIK